MQKKILETRLYNLGNHWVHIPGGLKYISVGDSGVWGVNRHDHIYYRVGTRGGHGSGITHYVYFTAVFFIVFFSNVNFLEFYFR